MAGIPFITQFDFVHGRMDRLSHRVWRLIANNPGPFTFTGSGSYLVGDEGGVAVIDPGPDNEEHIHRLITETPGPINHILVTHTHRDHCGGAGRLKQQTDAEILAFGKHSSTPDNAPPALDEGADFDFRPDRTLAHGEVISTPNYRLEAVHTPGHTDNHLCFAVDEERTLFTGDHIMGWSTTVIAPPGGNMDAYLRSLDALLERDDRRYLPTHGAPIDSPRAFVRAVKEHRILRDEQILTQAHGRGLMDIVKAVYVDTPTHLHGAAALNVQAHLERHIESGKVALVNGQYRVKI